MKKQLLLLTFLLAFVGCNTVTPIAVIEEKLPFTNDVRGVNLEYPFTWFIENSDTEGVFNVTVYNQESPDGYGCTEPLQRLGVTVTVRDGTKNFDEWFMDNYDAGGGLGSFGGEMEKTTFSGYPAYKVADMGFESYCGTSGYVVDYGGESVVLVTITANKEVPEYAQLKDMLESVRLSGQVLN